MGQYSFGVGWNICSCDLYITRASKKIEAASLIVLQIDELQDRIREISGYIVNELLNSTAFYESLPLIERNYWSEYKHYFVQKMDATSYNSLNQFYNYVSEIQEQQVLLKTLQHNHFHVTQTVLANIQTLFISTGIAQNYGGVIPQIMSLVNRTPPEEATEKDVETFREFAKQMFTKAQNFDAGTFWSEYNRQKSNLEYIINQNALTAYIPSQIKISLDNILKKYSMLEIVGCEGYHLLKKWSAKRF